LELQREQPKPWWSECGTVHWGKLNPAKKEVHNATSKTGSGARDAGYARQIKAEIPEVNKEDVKVTVHNGVLTIQGERKQEKEEKGKRFHRVERHYGSFTRSFTLPDNVDETKISASFKDGVLNLQIQKTEEAKPKSIEVKVE
jgi:HSP20 family molecular chaperone IbpA